MKYRSEEEMLKEEMLEEYRTSVIKNLMKSAIEDDQYIRLLESKIEKLTDYNIKLMNALVELTSMSENEIKDYIAKKENQYRLNELSYSIDRLFAIKDYQGLAD